MKLANKYMYWAGAERKKSPTNVKKLSVTEVLTIGCTDQPTKGVTSEDCTTL